MTILLQYTCCSVCSILSFVILVCVTGKLNFASDMLEHKEHHISELAVYTQRTPYVERPGVASAGRCVHAQVCISVRACICLDHSEKVNTNILPVNCGQKFKIQC